MVTPIYTYLIGKALNPKFYPDTSYDLRTGTAYTLSGVSACDKVGVSSPYLYLNFTLQYYLWGNLLIFSKAGEYMGYRPIAQVLNTAAKCSGVYRLPDNVGQIAMSVAMTNIPFFRIDGYINSAIYNLRLCNPHYKSLSKKYARENGQIFFRTSLEGKITLVGDDYKYVAGTSVEDKLMFVITKKPAKENPDKKQIMYYKGLFNKSDCRFDRDKEQCDLKTKPLDPYTNIMNGYDKEYDLIKLTPPTTTVGIMKRSLIQTYLSGSNAITNIFGGTYWEGEVIDPVASHDELINKYFFAYADTVNEFRVESSNPAANGLYSGCGRWVNSNNYYCVITERAEQGTKYKYLSLFSPEGNPLYQSMLPIKTDNRYPNSLTTENIQMVNVAVTGDGFTIDTPFAHHIYERLLCDVERIQVSGRVVDTHVLPPDDFVQDNRNYKRCIGLFRDKIYSTSVTTPKPTKFGRADNEEYFTDKFISVTQGIKRLIPICRKSWVNTSIWFGYTDGYELREKSLRKSYSLRDCYSVGAIIRALLSKIDPLVRHEDKEEYSQFLYGAESPLSSIDRFYVYLTPKSNVLKGDYDQPAKKAMISMEDIMKLLKTCFKCQWYIEDGKLKIEHVEFFRRGGRYSGDPAVQLDFTKLKDAFNKKLTAYFQSETEYDKNDLCSRYEFEWMDDSTEVFGNNSIDIKSNYIQKDKTEEVTAGIASSDVDYMGFEPSSFSNDGFALLCPVKTGDKYELPIIRVSDLIDESGSEYEAVVQNWYASWLYLQRLYMYDLPARNVYPDSVKQLRPIALKQSLEHSIGFPAEEDPDEIALIKTSVGNGSIDEMTINLNSRMAKIRLIYEPE